MEVKLPTQKFDSILSKFDPSAGKNDPVAKKAVSFWLPEDYKKKYDALQRASNNSFCEIAKELLMCAIDEATEKVRAK